MCFFTRMEYGCEKDYPVAIIHEGTRRIKEDHALAYFNDNALLDEDGLSYEEYPRADLDRLITAFPKYIQTVGFMFSSAKDIPEATFSNKFKHDYWKKIQSTQGLEALVDISALLPSTSDCEAEEALRAIIRKRKEVHQLKKITFVWIVEIVGENSNISTVMKHYFQEDIAIIQHYKKTFYLGWSTPLQNINMRYFVCPPE
ncbi:MAG: hypothetical protein Q9M36_11345 [Sulfurovum sp.]|nr:hypothetical protein [Sulfurovum sp.]